MDKSVIELFAGVGGFRVGLNNIKSFDENGRAIDNGNFKFVWTNQWEPSTKIQHAFDCYNLRFNDSNNFNMDIHSVIKEDLPDHTLLCGGFPCQDYSVARTKSNEKGIEGKKGVLWWDIKDILEAKRPPFVLLENVDRLLKSPSTQRGRDFGIMLYCFYKLNYVVEWRVINAADYGFAQRRRRIYIFAYNKETQYYKKIFNKKHSDKAIIEEKGIFANQFSIESATKYNVCHKLQELDDILKISNEFSFNFENSGYMRNGLIYTEKVAPKKIDPVCLKDILEHNVSSEFYLNEKQIEKIKYLRGSKKIKRIRPDGKIYYYSEGRMSDYDKEDLPGRTMLTSEASINRSSHIIKDENNKFRFLTPVECERLNGFPDEWTNSGMPNKRRYFMMGNALVCGVISKLGEYIEKIIEEEE